MRKPESYFHLILQPIEGICLKSISFPFKTASIAMRNSSRVTFCGCCQLSSNLPLYSNFLSLLYRKTLSTLKHRIRIAGKIQFLKNEIVSNKIRVLLFAGVRSAVLWHQLNGRYWRFFVYNKRISNTIGNINERISTEI